MNWYDGMGGGEQSNSHRKSMIDDKRRQKKAAAEMTHTHTNTFSSSGRVSITQVKPCVLKKVLVKLYFLLVQPFVSPFSVPDLSYVCPHLPILLP